MFTFAVRFYFLIWSRLKKVGNNFGPGLLSVYTDIYDSEPKYTEPEGIVMRSQPDWLALTY